MEWTFSTFLLTLVMAGIPGATLALKCKAGYPTLGQLTAPNLSDVDCSAPWFEEMCYVMFTDYEKSKYDAWTYGCILKGSLGQCNKAFEAPGVTNNYCCCQDPLCNSKDFAESCGKRTTK